MSMLAQQPHVNRSAGQAWVERFLVPQLHRRFGANVPLRCLQLWPDDQDEAETLNVIGHACEMATPANADDLEFAAGSFDFVFTGRMLRQIPERNCRVQFVRKIHEALAVHGAFLTVFGNRWCPLDLTRNGQFVHGPFAGSALSRREARKLFLEDGGFGDLKILSPRGHHVWQRGPGFLRPVGRMLELFWRIAERPRRDWLLSTPFNPTFIAWATKR